MTGLSRARVLAVLGAAVVIGGVAAFNAFVVREPPPAAGLLFLSSILAVAAVAFIAAEWPRTRDRLVLLSAVTAFVSVAVTVLHAPREVPRDAFWIVTEVFALLALMVLVVRWESPRRALGTGALLTVTVLLTIRRVTVMSPGDDVVQLIGAVMNWSLGPTLAVALGLYLRALDARRVRMIVEARRAQRLELARDLHDFVAHDVTGIVVQAQAGNVIARSDTEEAIAALERIEDAGLRALGSLDQTVQMLGEGADATERTVGTSDERSTHGDPTRRFRLEDVFGLVGRFAVTDRRPVRLHVDIGRDVRIPSAVVGTMYRVLLEALTNVRRHAPGRARVHVSITPCESEAGRALAISVGNDADGDERPLLHPPRAAERDGGRGLRALAEAVREVGGTFSAGALDPEHPHGWMVTAVLPLAEGGRP